MTRILVLAAGAAILAGATPISAQHPRISMQVARAHALALVPHGRIQAGELEREHGTLIYSFDIAVPGQPGIEEVQISALNGRLVSRTHESPAAERREARQEARNPGHR
jgi:uncharacterized membrane protein YkoI